LPALLVFESVFEEAREAVFFACDVELLIGLRASFFVLACWLFPRARVAVPFESFVTGGCLLSGFFATTALADGRLPVNLLTAAVLRAGLPADFVADLFADPAVAEAVLATDLEIDLETDLETDLEIDLETVLALPFFSTAFAPTICLPKRARFLMMLMTDPTP
jgi:hypothetical protein